MFTHFATADEQSGWDYKLQCKRFDEAVAAMKDAGFECGIVHCDNTPASILDPSTHYDMIRAGIGLYGLQPCETTRPIFPLDPVMSVRARVTRVAHPAMGEGVGYGFTYRVPRTRVQICTLPIGYADGLSRTLSNRMDVLYQGERIRQVGNICMDQCMVAISETSMGRMPEANYGDVMTIIGRDGDAEDHHGRDGALARHPTTTRWHAAFGSASTRFTCRGRSWVSCRFRGTRIKSRAR